MLEPAIGGGPSTKPAALSRRSRRDLLAIGALLIVGAALPAAFALASGAASIPRNDDWVYRRIALELSETGILSLHRVTTMMVGLIAVVQPILALVPNKQNAFVFAGTAFAIVAIFAAYGLSRRFLPTWQAGIAASLLLIFPGYLAYATSFMTDVPALAAQLGCLAIGVRAIRGREVRPWPLVISLVVGFAGFSIREFAAAAPIAVVAAAVWARPRKVSSWVIGLTFGICCIALYVAKAAQIGQIASGGTGGGTLASIVPVATTLSFVTFPAALVGARNRYSSWRRLICSSEPNSASPSWLSTSWVGCALARS